MKVAFCDIQKIKLYCSKCHDNCVRKRNLHRGERFVQYIPTTDRFSVKKKFALNLCNASGVQLLFTDAGHAEIESNVSLKNIDHCSCVEVDYKGTYLGDLSITPGCYAGNVDCKPTERLSGRLSAHCNVSRPNLYQMRSLRPHVVLL